MRVRVRWQCAAALIGALVLAGPAGATQGGQKVDSALRNAKSGKTERVIIRSRPGRRAELKRALKACGVKIKAEHALVDAVTAEAITREVGSLCETRKSGRLPAIPVSMTATPMPLPVAFGQV